MECSNRYNNQPFFKVFTFNKYVILGAIISEMLHTWARKAQGYGISLIPVPSDPFALPITLNSDPVRGPIFIEMDTDVISFEAFPDSTWDQRLFLFREAIAHKFGFINSATDRNQQPSSAMFSTHHQYIHCTGNMFLLIPTQLQLQTGIQVPDFFSSKLIGSTLRFDGIFSCNFSGHKISAIQCWTRFSFSPSSQKSQRL